MVRRIEIVLFRLLSSSSSPIASTVSRPITSFKVFTFCGLHRSDQTLVWPGSRPAGEYRIQITEHIAIRNLVLKVVSFINVCGDPKIKFPYNIAIFSSVSHVMTNIIQKN